MVSNRTVSDTETSGVQATSEPFHPLGRHLVFTAKALRTAFEDMLKRSGGSLGTWIVLSALSEEGGVSQKVLASHVHVEGATITHHVDRLEEQGLVRRQVDPHDRRIRRIELTPEGVRLHERLLADALAFERATLAGLDDADRAELRRLLDLIASNLDGLAD
ncbi:MAG TPA: MarR family transcriptional regulator [Gaiellaceae bacterium]|nr:MarR family transcriptional regulator [Gaiellaceae bacterium]